MEIKADRRPAHREALDQDALDEFVGGEARERRVKGQHDGAVEPGRGQQPQFSRPRDSWNNGSPGLKKARGCGSKVSAAAGRPSALARLRSRDHRLVAAVHAVEIADRDDGAAQGSSGAISRTTRKFFVGIGLAMVNDGYDCRTGGAVRTSRKVKRSGALAAPA